MKTQYKHKNMFGKDIKLPEVGKVTIPEDGILDLPDNVAKALIFGSPNNWASVDPKSEKESQKTKKNTQETETEEDGVNGENSEVEQSGSESDQESTDGESEDIGTRDEARKNLLKTKVEELHKVCLDSDFPEEEWGELKKGALIEYILDKNFG